MREGNSGDVTGGFGAEDGGGADFAGEFEGFDDGFGLDLDDAEDEAREARVGAANVFGGEGLVGAGTGDEREIAGGVDGDAGADGVVGEDAGYVDVVAGEGGGDGLVAALAAGERAQAAALD